MKTEYIKLTAKEEEVMNYFWTKGALFVRELLEFYTEPRPHFNTLSTIVRGLEEKGYLSHNAFGKTFQYYAIISNEEFKQMTLGNVIDKYYDNSLLSAVSALVERKAISRGELRELLTLIEKGE